MIKVRNYEHGDAFKIKPRHVYDGDPDLLNRVDQLTGNPDSCCSTFLNENDEIIAIIGLTLLWSGVADVWAVISDEIKKCPVTFHKQVKHALDFYSRELKILRYQVFVKASFHEGQKWMKSLRFKQEGYLPFFGPEQDDYVIMGRIN